MSSLSTLSRPTETVWQITIHNPPDNRLSPPLMREILEHLDTVEREWRLGIGATNPGTTGPGALVIASDNPKFFSNGFIPETLWDPEVRGLILKKQWRLLTFPLVTIAAVNGHAFAGGMLMAFCCDYRLMTAGKGLWSMNELLIGLPIANTTAELLRTRLTPKGMRDVLIAKRWTQKEALEVGIIDEIIDNTTPEKKDALIERAIDLGEELGERAATGAWGSIKHGMYWQVMESVKNVVVLQPQDAATQFFGSLKEKKAKL